MVYVLEYDMINLRGLVVESSIHLMYRDSLNMLYVYLMYDKVIYEEKVEVVWRNDLLL